MTKDDLSDILHAYVYGEAESNVSDVEILEVVERLESLRLSGYVGAGLPEMDASILDAPPADTPERRATFERARAVAGLLERQRSEPVRRELHELLVSLQARCEERFGPGAYSDSGMLKAVEPSDIARIRELATSNGPVGPNSAIADVLYGIGKLDDKPHQLFTALARLVRTYGDKDKRDELLRLCNEACLRAGALLPTQPAREDLDRLLERAAEDLEDLLTEMRPGSYRAESTAEELRRITGTRPAAKRHRTIESGGRS